MQGKTAEELITIIEQNECTIAEASATIAEAIKELRKKGGMKTE